MESPSLLALKKQARDDAVAAGEMKADAMDKLEKAAALLEEANKRMAKVRKMEEVNKARSKKLDQGFVRLNKLRDNLTRRQFALEDHDLIMEENKREF